MHKRKILIQLDTDSQASVFDGVVAVDAGVDFLFARGAVTPSNVRELVFGAIFTRGPEDLHHTAIFVGGSDVAAGESLLQEIRKAFFGPLRVSTMVDSNGANSTAAAAVLAVQRHVTISEITALVLGGTGPVGQRVVRLLAKQGARIRIGSRELNRSQQVAEKIQQIVPDARLQPVTTSDRRQTVEALHGVQVVIAAGAPGVQFLSSAERTAVTSLRLAIDLNAVPPVGLEGIEVMDYAEETNGVICYGAIGIGRTKMKIHKQAIKKLFDRNDQILDAEEIYAIGTELE